MDAPLAAKHDELESIEQLILERKKQLAETEHQLAQARLKVTVGSNDLPATPERASGHRKKPSVSLSTTGFFGGTPKRTVEIDTAKMEIFDTTTTAGNILQTVHMNGWRCIMKLIETEGMDRKQKEKLEKHLDTLETMPEHKNVVRYLFHEYSKTTLRVFMSWHWTSLRQWLREYPQSSADKSPGNNVSPLSYTVVAMLMMDLCLAVEFLHARSFVHRAITPEDIFIISVDGSPRLLLGNCEHGESLSSTSQAVTQKSRGGSLLPYQPPEVHSAKDTGAYDFRVDVWAIGMILYELTTGRRPFDRVAEVTIGAHILQGKKPTVDVVKDELRKFLPMYCAEERNEPNHLVYRWEQCTEYYPDERPSLATIKEQLMECAAGRTPSVRDPSANHKLQRRGREAGHVDLGFSLDQDHKREGQMFERFIVVGLPLDWQNGAPAKPVVLYEYPVEEKMQASHELVGFCFPSGVLNIQICSQLSDLAEKVFSVPLDSLDGPSACFTFTIFSGGKAVYGVCIHVDEVVQAPPSFFPVETTSDSFTAVAPRCYCFLTRFPFFKLHFGVLRSLLERERLYNTNRFLLETPRGKEGAQKAAHNAVMQLLHAYHQTEVPKKCESLSFKLPGELRSIEFYCPPGSQDRFIANWCVPVLCRSLSLENVETVLLCCMLEKQMVFTSKHLGIVSHAVMSLLALLRPYVWHGTFLPVLPRALHECLQAPVPFLLGVHASGPAQSETSEQAVIVSLDKDQVSLPSNWTIPACYRRSQLHDSLKGFYSIIRPSSVPLASIFKATVEQQKAVQGFVHAIREWHTNFLDALRQKIPADRRSFDFSRADDVQALLNAIDLKYRPFVSGLLQTQMFTVLTDQFLLSPACDIGKSADGTN